MYWCFCPLHPPPHPRLCHYQPCLYTLHLSCFCLCIFFYFAFFERRDRLGFDFFLALLLEDLRIYERQWQAKKKIFKFFEKSFALTATIGVPVASDSALILAQQIDNGVFGSNPASIKEGWKKGKKTWKLIRKNLSSAALLHILSVPTIVAANIDGEICWSDGRPCRHCQPTTSFCWSANRRGAWPTQSPSALRPDTTVLRVPKHWSMKQKCCGNKKKKKYQPTLPTTIDARAPKSRSAQCRPSPTPVLRQIECTERSGTNRPTRWPEQEQWKQNLFGAKKCYRTKTSEVCFLR